MQPKIFYSKQPRVRFLTRFVSQGYVLMARRSEFLIPDENQVRETDSLLRHVRQNVRQKVRVRRTSSGDSADHSSEQDSSDCKLDRFVS